jgi:hypothetical protein
LSELIIRNNLYTEIALIFKGGIDQIEGNKMLSAFLKSSSDDEVNLILAMPKQIKAWRKANRKMKWQIAEAEFDRIQESPELTADDQHDGFIGVILSYGFGDDGNGNSDTVLSCKLAWEYACRRRRVKTWQCQYVDFNKTEDIRLRPGAPIRPKGFYYAKFQPGEKFQNMKVSQLRKRLKNDTGCGPEGIQFLTITHSHFPKMMDERKIPFMALADYDVAPHGFNDFFDAPQIFCSIGVLGLGIGNVDRNYPLFGIPTLRLQF